MRTTNRSRVLRATVAGCFAVAGIAAMSTAAPADTLPVVSVSDATVVEPVTGNAKLEFTVSIPEAAAATVRVRFTTSDGTAVRPGDYNKRASTVTIPKGQTTRIVNVIVKRDALDEADETVNVTLTDPKNATLGDDVGIGTIVDSD